MNGVLILLLAIDFLPRQAGFVGAQRPAGLLACLLTGWPAQRELHSQFR